MINEIWDYIGHKFDEEGYIPHSEETEEALVHLLTLDELERIDEITERFMNFHDLTGIDVRYEKPLTQKQRMIELEERQMQEQRREVS